jgi:hypothetical protein
MYVATWACYLRRSAYLRSLLIECRLKKALIHVNDYTLAKKCGYLVIHALIF